jgi:hypothetical protein
VRPAPTVITPGIRMADAGRAAVSTAQLSVRFAIGTVTFPVEVATSTLNILRLTEQLMEELVYTLRAARPLIEGVGSAYRAGHFDPVFKTIGQIQQSANAIAFVWTPIDAVRGVITPGEWTAEWRPQNVVRAIAAPAAGGPSRVLSPVGEGFVVGARVARQVGAVPVSAVKHASTMPGAGLVTGPARVLLGALPIARTTETVAEQGGSAAGKVGLRIPSRHLTLPRIDLRTPDVAVRIPSLRVTVPNIAVRTPSLSVRVGKGR